MGSLTFVNEASNEIAAVAQRTALLAGGLWGFILFNQQVINLRKTQIWMRFTSEVWGRAGALSSERSEVV